MASSAKQTIDFVRNGARVVLNLGMGGPAPGLSPVARLTLYKKSLAEFVKPGFVAHLLPQAVTMCEPVLVMSGHFKDYAADSLLIWDMIVSAQQDCIAIYYPDLDDPKGYLMGPNVEAWGEFDLDMFEFPIQSGGTDD